MNSRSIFIPIISQTLLAYISKQCLPTTCPFWHDGSHIDTYLDSWYARFNGIPCVYSPFSNLAHFSSSGVQFGQGRREVQIQAILADAQQTVAMARIKTLKLCWYSLTGSPYCSTRSTSGKKIYNIQTISKIFNMVYLYKTWHAFSFILLKYCLFLPSPLPLRRRRYLPFLCYERLMKFSIILFY